MSFVSARKYGMHRYPQHHNGPRQPPTPARFDTMLVLVGEEEHGRSGFHGKVFSTLFHQLSNLLEGLRAAEIRAIVMLPRPRNFHESLPGIYSLVQPLRRHYSDVHNFTLNSKSSAKCRCYPVIQMPKFPSGAINLPRIRHHSIPLC